MRALVLTTIALASSSAAAQAAPQAFTRASGIVSARFSYDQTSDSFGTPMFSGERLAIMRSGQVFYDQPVTSGHCDPECAVITAGTAPGPFDGPLTVADLEHVGQADVALALYTGGAHCCEIVQVYSYDPGAMVYTKTEHDFGDPGAVISDLRGDGRLEFSSADDRFAYAFTSFAFSGLPIRIFRFSAGRFVDVTRSFPALIAHDAAHWFFRFTKTRGQGLGLGEIAAWAADEYMLGKQRTVSHTLARELRLGYLRSADNFNAGGGKFVAALKTFLRRNGY